MARAVSVGLGKAASSAEEGLRASIGIYRTVLRVIGAVRVPLQDAERDLSLTVAGKHSAWERQPAP